MVVEFHTKNLDKRLHNRMILRTLQTYKSNKWISQFLKDWIIKIYSLDETDPRFFEHYRTTSGQRINPNMPSGVTGQYEIKLWLHDSDNVFKARENSDRIQHEVLHAMLFGRNDWVSRVHDNINKRIIRTFWYWKFPFFRKFRMSIIDIR